MSINRRDFLKGTAWMGAAAMAAGCANSLKFCGAGGMMHGFAVAPLKKVRVGVVGLGSRGASAAHRISMIPGVEVTALCDIRKERVEGELKWFKDNKKPTPKVFWDDENSWRKMCEWDGIDCVYNVTPWSLHAPIGVYAMECGKHVYIEVPAAMTVDECWELVETAERTKLHCMQLENCCYGEYEMLALNLCRQGKFGDLVHGECAYIHDLRKGNYMDQGPADGLGYWKYWRLRWNQKHKGNQYTTHGLGPICQYMNINRGDRFDYIVSLESRQANYEAYAKHLFPNTWKASEKVEMGDMNTTLIRTVNGCSIMLQHDVSSPRPYSRINMITGTKGIFHGMPWRTYGKDPSMMRLGWEEKPGDGLHKFFAADKIEEIRNTHKHPLWKSAGEIAKKVGGHGGMDFLMDLRWAYCLQNGLPMDMDVYDLASWCCIAELSEKSVRNRSKALDVPDFTRGGWRTAKPLGIVNIDISKLGLDNSSVTRDSAQLNV
jgi:predicted dehydrogenase